MPNGIFAAVRRAQSKGLKPTAGDALANPFQVHDRSLWPRWDAVNRLAPTHLPPPTGSGSSSSYLSRAGFLLGSEWQRLHRQRISQWQLLQTAARYFCQLHRMIRMAEQDFLFLSYHQNNHFLRRQILFS